MPMQVDVVTQERTIFTTDAADMVILPGSEGVIGVLPRHAPLLTTLKLGELRIVMNGAEEIFAVYGGIVEVRPDRVVILADMAEKWDEIDLNMAEEAQRRAEEMMLKGPPPDQAAVIMQELRRAELAVRIRRSTHSRAGSVQIRSEE